MNYTLNRLNPTDFEHLVQSLMQRILGYNSIVFGTGADGGREMTFEGSANFPSSDVKWSGNWIIQAKYKMQEDGKDEYKWVETHLKKELKKIIKLKNRPDNYIFLTNVKLTGVKNTGGRDKIENLKNQYTEIKNIFIGGYDDICRILDNNRDVATAYSSFILTGDVLIQAINAINEKKYSELECIDMQNKLSVYYLKEFEIESTSKLIQAGDFANNSINLERVFMDLEVELNEYIEGKKPRKFMAVSHVVDESNKISRPDINHKKFVFLGSAGAGKSTISQYLYLLYICYFLKYVDKKAKIEIDEFIEESEVNNIKVPRAYRIPFRIILKDYAGWVNDKEVTGESSSILRYIVYKINVCSDAMLDIQFMRELFEKFSFIFILDGLDEVPHSHNREKVIENINSFVEVDLYDSNCDSIIIATTRPQGYMAEFNKEKYKHLHLSELSNDICIKYLNKLLINIEKDPDLRNNYLNGLEKALQSETTSRLMRSPLQATIMAILVRAGGEPSSNKYELFKQYYETIFKREKQKKVYDIITRYENHINKIHNKLGFKLQSESQNIVNVYSNIDIDEFEHLIKDYLLSEEWANNEIYDFIEEFKRTITQRLVFISEVETKKVGFVVRSIQEFFAANYYMDADDLTVKKRIRNIATNAYWRNTFLFCVGYIRLNKNHLIEYIYDYCLELNENFTEEEFSINTKVYPGSWLALDILSEGIFNDTPRNYNRFGSLLYLLLNVPNINEHTKFGNILNKIKEKWVIDRILTNPNTLQIIPETVYNIAVMFLNSGSTSITEKCLLILNSAENEYLTFILQELINREILDDLFYDFFSKNLVGSINISDKYFINQLIDSDQIHIIPNFIEEKGVDSLEAKQLFEVVVLLAISDMFFYDNTNGIDLIFKSYNHKWPNIISILNHEAYEFKRLFYKNQEVRVSTDLQIVFRLTSVENLFPVKCLKEISQYYNIEYLECFFEYIINPSFYSFNEFLHKLSNQSFEVISIFSEVKCNWQMQYYFDLWIKNMENASTPSDALPIILTENNSIEDFESKLINLLDLKTSLLHASYFNFQSNDSQFESDSILTIYYNKYLAEKKHSFDELEINLIFNLLSNNPNSLNKLENILIENFIKDILVRRYTYKSYEFSNNYFKTWINCINHYEIEYLFQLISKSNCFNNDLLIDPHIYFFRSDFIGLNIDLVKKLFNLLNIFISLESTNSYPRFIKYLLSIHFFERIDEYTFDNQVSLINFHNLYKLNYTEPVDCFSKFLLLLLSPQNPFSSIKEAADIFTKLVDFNSIFVNQLIRFLDQRILWTPWVLDLVCEIEPIININLPIHSPFRTQFYKYMKNSIEYKLPTEI